MLNTTKNQLSLEQIRLKHKQLIINELTKAGYADIISDTNTKYFTLPHIVHPWDSPIDSILELYDIKDLYENVVVSNYDITCEKFSTNDIVAVANLYIHMLKNNIKDAPNVIKNLDTLRVEPGQLAEIISEYLTKEKN